MIERTVAILKPDVVLNKETGDVLAHLEAEHKIVAMRMVQFTREQAKAFYHNLDSSAAWYESHIDFMSSGPCVVVVLEREDAITFLRQLIGPTDPKKCDFEHIRGMFGTELPRNAIHASDSPAAAEFERTFFGWMTTEVT